MRSSISGALRIRASACSFLLLSSCQRTNTKALTRVLPGNQGAEEFRAAKRGRDEGAPGKGQPRGAKRARGVAFGSGVADEDGAFGITEDYAGGDGVPEGYSFELASDEEDDAAPSGCDKTRELHSGVTASRASAFILLPADHHVLALAYCRRQAAREI